MVGERDTQDTIHATSLALKGQGVLLRGPSGSGKSTLALELMARGAMLISDDQTILTRRGDAIFASAPTAIRGMIEARGIGLLAAETLSAAPVRLIVDMDKVETERLPPWRNTCILGQEITLLHKVEHGHFPAAILQYLKAGRRA